MKTATLLCCLLFMTVSCKLRPTTNIQSSTSSGFENDWEKKRWIQKAAKVLWVEDSLTESRVGTLSKMDEDKILDILISDKKFERSFYNFHNYYAGFLMSGDFSDSIIDFNREHRYSTFNFNDFTSNYIALIEYRKNGDIFQQFNYNIPKLLGLKNYQYEADTPEERIKAKQKTTEEIAKQRVKYKKIVNEKNFDYALLCKEIINLNGGGDPEDLNAIDSAEFDGDYYESILRGEILTACAIKNRDRTKIKDAFLNTIESIELVEKLIREKKYTSYFKSSDGESEIIKLPDEFQINEKNGIALDSNSILGNQFWNLNTSSKTDLNFKRAAAVLRTYFCDDLTPIDLDIASSDEHSQGAHGTDPNCRSCHYKLSPMGGFFRYHGISGANFKKLAKFGGFGEVYEAFIPADTIFLMDGFVALKSEEYREYLLEWKTKEVPNGRWEVGHILSDTDRSLNFYNTNNEKPLEELFEYISKSAEVKKCYAQRLSEFFINPNQTFDPEWISGLGKTLTKSQKNSSQGLRDVLKIILKSNAFKHPDPEQGVCYDGPSLGKNNSFCSVASIIKSNCVQCHNSADPSEDTIDFLDWGNKDNEWKFKHYHGGKLLSKKASFEMIKERLHTSDKSLRMPIMKSMKDNDRLKMTKWLEKEIN